MSRTLTRHDELTIVKLLAKGKDVGFVAVAVQVPEDAVTAVGEANGWPDAVRLGWAADHLQSTIDDERRAEHGGRLTEPPLPRPVRERVQDPRPAPAARPAPTPAQVPRPVSNPTQPVSPRTTLADLLATAGQSHKASTRAKGVKLGKLVDELRKIIADESVDRERLEREAAERAELEKQAADLEAQLKAARAKLAKLTGAGNGNGNAGKHIAYTAEFFTRTGTTRAELIAWAAGKGVLAKEAGMIKRALLDEFEASRDAQS